MRRPVAIVIGMAALPLLGGCVAAALPVLAAGTVVRSQTDFGAGEADDSRIVVDRTSPTGPREPILRRASALIPPPDPQAGAAAPATAATAAPTAPVTPAALAAPTTIVAATATPTAAPVPLTPGSSHALFVSHSITRARLVSEGAPVTSLVLANGLLAREPEYVACGRQPPAVIIDLDSGEGAPAPFAPDTPTQADPQMIAALAAIRSAGVEVLWISDNRSNSAGEIAVRLRASGLDPAGRDAVLLPEGDADRKQLRRLRAATTHCIIAVAGDSRADADEVYDYLRDPNTPLPIDANWDAGWFLLPPPLHAAPTRPGDE